jgi:hypothetical protein
MSESGTDLLMSSTEQSGKAARNLAARAPATVKHATAGSTWARIGAVAKAGGKQHRRGK